jgi:hypothetical protein
VFQYCIHETTCRCGEAADQQSFSRSPCICIFSTNNKTLKYPPICPCLQFCHVLAQSQICKTVIVEATYLQSCVPHDLAIGKSLCRMTSPIFGTFNGDLISSLCCLLSNVIPYILIRHIIEIPPAYWSLALSNPGFTNL